MRHAKSLIIKYNQDPKCLQQNSSRRRRRKRKVSRVHKVSTSQRNIVHFLKSHVAVAFLVARDFQMLGGKEVPLRRCARG